MTQPSNFIYTDEQDEYIEIAIELEQVLGDAIREHELVLIGHPTRWANGHKYWRDGELGVDTDTAGMIWVHPIGKPIDDNETGVDAGIPFLVLNDGGIDDSQSAFGTPVKIKRRGGQKVIDGLAGDIGTEYYHNVKVRNQRSVDISQFDYGLIKPTSPPSEFLFWSGGVFVFDGVAYTALSRKTSAIISPEPIANKAIYVLIEYNPVTDTLIYTRGSAFDFDSASMTPQHNQAIANKPNSIDATRFLIGWVRVYNGMTTILIGDILPRIEMLNKDTIPTVPSLTVTDGATSVIDATTINFNSGAVVTDNGSGEALVDISGGGSSLGDTAIQTLFAINEFTNTLSGALTNLAHNNVIYDPESVVDDYGTNKHHIPQAGIYKTEWTLSLVPDTPSGEVQLTLGIYINNSIVAIFEYSYDDNSINTNGTISGQWIESLSKDDKIEFKASFAGDSPSIETWSQIAVYKINGGSIVNEGIPT